VFKLFGALAKDSYRYLPGTVPALIL